MLYSALSVWILRRLRPLRAIAERAMLSPTMLFWAGERNELRWRQAQLGIRVEIKESKLADEDKLVDNQMVLRQNRLGCIQEGHHRPIQSKLDQVERKAGRRELNCPAGNHHLCSEDPVVT